MKFPVVLAAFATIAAAAVFGATANAPDAAPAATVFRDTSGWFPFEFPLDDTNLDSSGKRTRQLDAGAAAGVIVFDPAGAASIWCEIVTQ